MVEQTKQEEVIGQVVLGQAIMAIMAYITYNIDYGKNDLSAYVAGQTKSALEQANFQTDLPCSLSHLQVFLDPQKLTCQIDGMIKNLILIGRPYS